MFIKYPKTYRILVPQIDIKGKRFLSNKEVKELLGGIVSVQEKMDGANVGIIRTKNDFRLQKRGSLVGTSEHEQFNRFKAWSNQNYDKLMQLPINHVLFGELMFCKHTVFYNALPDYFLAFAVFDRLNEQYLHRDKLENLCNKLNISCVPEICKGFYNKTELFDLIPSKSFYGNEPPEGVVVWNYKRQLRGKIVKKKFQECMDHEGHWMRKKITYNLLKTG